MTDVATRITDAAAGVLGRRLGRRSLLRRAAVAGSALSVAPLKFALQPGSAYAAICGCANQNCDCGSACCDGYTEFCCTLTGQNSCPPGSIIGGWWKADGSGLCAQNGADGPRYYMDCNAPAAAPCGPGGVTSAATNCGCGCTGGNCGNRWNCCTAFRYGQCNQHVPCLGPILCRVVTCVPPWAIDGTCTTAVATDNFTAGHDAPCLHASADIAGVAGSLPAMVSWGWWYRGIDRFDQADRGAAPYNFGGPGDIPVFGDWNGDGSASPGVVRGNQWILSNVNQAGGGEGSFVFGDPGDIPVVGDWVGDGISRPGVVRGNVWFLRLSHTSGPADISFVFGDPGDIPVVGDWNGDGVFTPGMVRGNTWYLRNSNTTGVADIAFTYGEPGDIPVARGLER